MIFAMPAAGGIGAGLTAATVVENGRLLSYAWNAVQRVGRVTDARRLSN